MSVEGDSIYCNHCHRKAMLPGSMDIKKKNKLLKESNWIVENKDTVHYCPQCTP